MICEVTPLPRQPRDLAFRAKALGLSIERAKFLVACPHTDNPYNKPDGQVIVVPFDPEVQINEAKRMGIGALDAAEMFDRPVADFIARGFNLTTPFPRPPGNGAYSLLQHETWGGAWKSYKKKPRK